MVFIMKVLLVSILFSSSLALSREVPRKHIETPSDLPLKYIFAEYLPPDSQRRRRKADINTTGPYVATYYKEDSKRLPLREETSISQRHCRCPQDPGRRRWHEYPPQRGYGYGGSSRGNRYSPFGGRFGYGYPSRMKGSSWWFDRRDDYADDILVYRFYNGGIRQRIRKVGNIPKRIGYQVQEGSTGGEFQGASTSGTHGSAFQYQSYPHGSRNYGSSSYTFEAQGARPIGIGSSNPDIVYSEEYNEHSLESDITEYEFNDESASEENGGYPVTQDNGSKPKGKVKTFNYWAGIWEEETVDDFEKTTPQTVINTGGVRRTEKFLFSTTTRGPPRTKGYRHDDCCYQKGYGGGRRGGNNGSGQNSNKKPINFFGITWSRLLDYGDVTDEVHSDGKTIIPDTKNDRIDVVTNSDEQVADSGGEFI